MPPRTYQMTAEDLARLPSDLPCELIEGELVLLSPSGGDQGWIQHEVARVLGNYVHEHKLGRMYGMDTGFRISRDPDTVRGPDVAFVRKDRIVPTPHGFVPHAPDFVVEILSPSDKETDLLAKARMWPGAGVELVWIIYPTTTSVRVMRPGAGDRVLHEADTIDAEPVLRGFSCKVAEFFQG